LLALSLLRWCGNGRCGRESERKGESAPRVRARASEQEELDESVRAHAFVRAHTRKLVDRMPNHGMKCSLLSHYCLTSVSLLSLYWAFVPCPSPTCDSFFVCDDILRSRPTLVEVNRRMPTLWLMLTRSSPLRVMTLQKLQTAHIIQLLLLPTLLAAWTTNWIVPSLKWLEQFTTSE